MRKLIFGLLCSWSFVAQGAVTVTDTIYSADGTSYATGSIQISWPAFLAGNGHYVAAGSKIVAIGGAGAFSTTLEPNDTMVPAGTLYVVQQRVQGGPSPYPITYWSCPTSASPLTISQCLTTTVASPSGIINISQLSPVGANGTCIVSNGTSYTTGVCGATASCVTVSYSATPTFDGGSGTVRCFDITLTGNITSCTLANFTVGQIAMFDFLQDGTGSRTVTCAALTDLGTVAGQASKSDKQLFSARTSSTAWAYGTMWCPECSPASVTIPGSSSGSATVQAAATAGGTQTIPNATANFGLTLPFAALTDAATVTWAIASVSSDSRDLTFTVHSGSRTLNITNPLSGGSYVLWIKQDATGGEGLTLGSGCIWKVSGSGGGAITPSVAANAIDVLAFTYDGTNCYANFNKSFN